MNLKTFQQFWRGTNNSILDVSENRDIVLCLDQMRSPYSEVLVTSLDKRVDDNKDTPSICSHFNNLFSKSFSGKTDLSQVQEVVSPCIVASQDSSA